MTSAMAIQSDTTWLQLPDYEIAPLNGKLAARLSELKHALRGGVYAFSDPGRKGFYDVELPTGWAYVHIHDDKRMVYLIAFSRM